MNTKTVKLSIPVVPRVGPDWLTMLGFAIVVLGIGLNVVAIRFSDRSMPPLWGAGMRFGIASLIFLLYVALRRYPLPKGRALAGAVLFGILQFGIYFALAYFALTKVPAGLMAVILATSPVFTLLFASAARIEHLTMRSVIGSLVAFGGIAFIFGSTVSSDIPWLYLLAAITGVAVVSLAAVVFKLVPPVNPPVMNGVAMFTGSLLLLSLPLPQGKSQPSPLDSPTGLYSCM